MKTLLLVIFTALSSNAFSTDLNTKEIISKDAFETKRKSCYQFHLKELDQVLRNKAHYLCSREAKVTSPLNHNCFQHEYQELHHSFYKGELCPNWVIKKFYGKKKSSYEECYTFHTKHGNPWPEHFCQNEYILSSLFEKYNNEYRKCYALHRELGEGFSEQDIQQKRPYTSCNNPLFLNRFNDLRLVFYKDCHKSLSKYYSHNVTNLCRQEKFLSFYSKNHLAYKSCLENHQSRRKEAYQFCYNRYKMEEILVEKIDYQSIACREIMQSYGLSKSTCAHIDISVVEHYEFNNCMSAHKELGNKIAFKKCYWNNRVFREVASEKEVRQVPRLVESYSPYEDIRIESN